MHVKEYFSYNCKRNIIALSCGMEFDMLVIRKNTLILAGTAIIATAVLAGTFLLRTEETFATNKFCVIVDAGHGDPDGGAVGIGGSVEKDINLAIALKTAEVLEGSGVKTVLTRLGNEGIYGDAAETIREKKVDDMHRRLDIINNSGANLLLSIHMNSFTDSSAEGLHIFYNREDDNLKGIADSIKTRVGEVTNATTHDIRKADMRVYLMKNAKIDAILVECGFLSNPEEEKKLNDEEYQSKMAWAIADAVLKSVQPE